jgi:hypothetical protein
MNENRYCYVEGKTDSGRFKYQETMHSQWAVIMIFTERGYVMYV